MVKNENGFVKETKRINKSILKAEHRAKNVAKYMLKRKRFSRMLHILGPGVITGAADDDPSGIATYSQAGAKFGLGFLWAFPIMWPLLVAVQESCSRIGAVTGKGLAVLIKENYSKKMLYASVFLVVVASTINIGSDLGAMAATTQLFLPDFPYEVLAVFYAILILALVIFIKYKRYAKILKWLAISLFAYPITAMIIGQDWGEIFSKTFMSMPTINAETMYIFVGILGTTISPYCFFWDTSEVVEEEIVKHRLAENGNGNPRITKHYLKSIRLDNFFGMSLTIVTAWFIVVACSAVLFSNGSATEITSAADAASALEPLVRGFPYSGTIAKIIFSVGIIGIGLLAVPVLAGSSAYAISETLGWKEGLHWKFRRAIGFYGILIASTIVGLAINFFQIDPIQALIFTAVFNGIAAVPLLWMIVRIGSNKKIMGEYKNGLISNIFVRLAFMVMLVAALMLFYFLFTGQLK